MANREYERLRKNWTDFVADIRTSELDDIEFLRLFKEIREKSSSIIEERQEEIDHYIGKEKKPQS